MQFQKLTKINLITGSLGAGKTTLLRHLLEQKPKDENWKVIINEFGAVGIDQAIVESSGVSEVFQLSGGCICCSNQDDLIQILNNLNQAESIDRIIIEPTGIGEPEVIIDLINSLPLKMNVDIATIFSVFDCQQSSSEDFEMFSYLKNILHASDVVVFNKKELVSEEKISSLHEYCQGLYPPKEDVLFTSNCVIPENLLNHHTQQTFKFAPHCNISTSHAPLIIEPDYITTDSPFLISRQLQKSPQQHSIGWIFDATALFDWQQLKALFESVMQEQGHELIRLKGVFRLGKPTMLFQVAQQQLTREYLSYRRDSRIELILAPTNAMNFAQFETLLINCIKEQEE